MAGGALRERIRIQRRVENKNPTTGGLERTWQPVATIWAEVKSINGREAVIGNVLQGISFFQITVRWRTDLKASDQVIWLTNGNRELNIVGPPEDREGLRRWTIFQASTQAPEGA